MIPFWVFEFVRLTRERYIKALAVGILTVALIVTNVWR